MEKIRRQMLGDSKLYPELAPRQPREVISVSSSATSSTDSGRFKARTPQVNISDSESESGSEHGDSEDDVAPSRPPAIKTNTVNQASIPLKKPVLPHLPTANALRPNIPGTYVPAAGVPIRIPSNGTSPFVAASTSNDAEPGELIDLPQQTYVGDFMANTDTEKALKELMSGSMNDEEADIDMSEAIVKGFKENIRLLPHQVIGKKWMKEREDVTQKRYGGILADDMGLGKTIQALARIAEGRPHKSDKADGWDACTLVVCPLALVGQWADEVKKMCTQLEVLQHHGPNRPTDPNVLRRHHIVVTTYDVVKSEYAVYRPEVKDESKSKAKKKKAASDSDDDIPAVKKAAKKGPKRDAIFRIKWWRVILDEAHNIKNHITKGAVACCDLDAKFRWCLTGTPMQNGVMEIYSLLKFLRIKPLNNIYTFKDQIDKPVRTGQKAGLAMKRLQVVLKAIMLRRTKTDTLNGKKLIELPARVVEIVNCKFNPSERNFYHALENRIEEMLEKLMAQDHANYTSVLLLLLRLRQACNHPGLVAKDYKEDLAAVDSTAAKNADDKADDADELANAFESLGVTKKCKVCQEELNGSNVDKRLDDHCEACGDLAYEARLKSSERPDSAKIRMILKLLQDVDDRSAGEEKTIIFSQFTSMLDLIQPFLREKGVRFVRYDGSMSRPEREESLDAIKKKPNVRCILISFKAGSTGLNLTCCNNVILVDPWWNPALEDQAFDRAHRYGQTRDVNIYKLMIAETVEDRILELQTKKRALAQAALSGDKLKNMRLGMDDLLALFRPGGRDDDDDEEDF
ncbi:SNF2/RAD54 Helicase and Transcription Factor [Pleurotus pulmonarius]